MASGFPRVALLAIAVGAIVTATALRIATLRERFAIRGRTGAGELADPARAGGALGDDVADTPRKSRGAATLTAPTDLRGFAAVTGDHNPIHTSVAVLSMMLPVIWDPRAMLFAITSQR